MEFCFKRHETCYVSINKIFLATWKDHLIFFPVCDKL